MRNSGVLHQVRTKGGGSRVRKPDQTEKPVETMGTPLEIRILEFLAKIFKPMLKVRSILYTIEIESLQAIVEIIMRMTIIDPGLMH